MNFELFLSFLPKVPVDRSKSSLSCINSTQEQRKKTRGTSMMATELNVVLIDIDIIKAGNGGTATEKDPRTQSSPQLAAMNDAAGWR